MKRFLRIILFLFFYFLFFIFNLSTFNSNLSSSYAQFRYPQGTGSIQIGASVGQYSLDISGYASPYASIILTSDGFFLRSAVADQNGNFYISQVLISAGFSRFCLTAVDFKQIGDSQACIDIPPASGDVVIRDIFLPPTIGLSKKQANAGEKVIVYGYSMPKARITIFVNGAGFISLTTDATGFYSYEFKADKAGTYRFKATASLKEKESLPPQKEVTLKALSFPEQITVTGQGFWSQLWNLITTTGIGLALVCIILIILIIIVLLKLRPKWLSAILDKLKIKEPMHHDWLLNIL